jgi:hypothetical protein
MLIEDEHYRDLYRLQRSRAALALVCGMLYGNLHHIEYLLGTPGVEFDSGLKAKLTDAITDTLKIVQPILNREFYPQEPAKPAAASEQTAKGPETENPGDQIRVVGGGK